MAQRGLSQTVASAYLLAGESGILLNWQHGGAYVMRNHNWNVNFNNAAVGIGVVAIWLVIVFVVYDGIV